MRHRILTAMCLCFSVLPSYQVQGTVLKTRGANGGENLTQPRWEYSNRLPHEEDCTTDTPAESCALKFTYDVCAYHVPEETVFRQDAQIRLCAMPGSDSPRKTILQTAHSAHQRWDIAPAVAKKEDEK